MLYRYRLTGGLVEVVSKHGEGIVMCLDSQDEVLYVEETSLVPHLEATTEKIKNEEKLTAELKSEGVKDAKLTTKDTFPADPGINVNNASARQIAERLPGVGLKTARDIKDLQSSLPGERFHRLDQLTSIKRVDWEEIFKDNLVRVD
jgi:DNA uptake protein ComE-like DNA-binding protein